MRYGYEVILFVPRSFMLTEWPCTLPVLCEVACLLEDQDFPVSEKAGPFQMSTIFFVRGISKVPALDRVFLLAYFSRGGVSWHCF